VLVPGPQYQRSARASRSRILHATPLTPLLCSVWRGRSPPTPHARPLHPRGLRSEAAQLALRYRPRLRRDEIRLRNERGKFAVRGSRQGIFLAAVPAQKTLFVCEGPTDTAGAVELGLFGVGRPNCCCGGAEIRTYARRHECAKAVIVSDNDKPGLDGARKVGGELKLPYAVYVPPAKDLREFVRLGGTRAMIENTLNHTVWNV